MDRPEEIKLYDESSMLADKLCIEITQVYWPRLFY